MKEQMEGSARREGGGEGEAVRGTQREGGREGVYVPEPNRSQELERGRRRRK